MYAATEAMDKFHIEKVSQANKDLKENVIANAVQPGYRPIHQERGPPRLRRYASPYTLTFSGSLIHAKAQHGTA